MFSRSSGAIASAVTCCAVVLGLTACGGDDGGDAASATDKTAGLTVTVKDDQVRLKRSASSAAGTAGTSATVSCTDDYAKLVKATAVPAPSQPWYATTLITWPEKNKETTARLSHGLDGDPQLCVAQTADSSASTIIYFDAKAKAGVQKLQVQDSQSQQAQQAPAALKAAAQAAVGTVSKGAFPKAQDVVAAITAQGLYAKQAATTAAATDAGTLYVIADQTTTKNVVIAIKDNQGKVQTATQGVKGSPKIATAK
jgi:hypothetical protein